MGEHYGEVGCCRPICWLLLLLMLWVIGLCGGQVMVDPITRPCHDLGKTDGAEVAARVSINTYVAGGVMAALVSLPADLSGFFEFYLCPEEGNTAQEECLVRLPLQLADGSGARYDLADVPDKKLHEVLLILPDEVTCDTCTLQLRVVMKKCTGGGRRLDNGLDINDGDDETLEMEEEEEEEKEDQEADDDGDGKETEEEEKEEQYEYDYGEETEDEDEEEQYEYDNGEETEEEQEADEDEGQEETEEEICKAISQLFCSDISIRQVK
ncbi:hypothetical protein Pcinc_028285 [Petrolisthes cinctipes]|uniref:Uncharacterized protein n=1 Tax=Petrolisthes cinctipes TaxID=88211 RepID=A0AAE1K7H5_PETCI|nr:hypothetical protein Pcinc_028285 [Petrolisthes cinctipes]